MDNQRRRSTRYSCLCFPRTGSNVAPRDIPLKSPNDTDPSKEKKQLYRLENEAAILYLVSFFLLAGFAIWYLGWVRP